MGGAFSTGAFGAAEEVFEGFTFPGSGKLIGNGTLDVIGGYVLNEDGTYALDEDGNRQILEPGTSYQLNEDGTYAVNEDGYRIILENGVSYALNEDGTYALDEDGNKIPTENSVNPQGNSEQIPGVATQLSLVSVPASMIWITPKSYNRETIWLFDSTVAVDNGVPIYPGAKGQFFPILDLSDLWIIGAITEGIDYHYLYTATIIPTTPTNRITFLGDPVTSLGDRVTST